MKEVKTINSMDLISSFPLNKPDPLCQISFKIDGKINNIYSHFANDNSSSGQSKYFLKIVTNKNSLMVYERVFRHNNKLKSITIKSGTKDFGLPIIIYNSNENENEGKLYHIRWSDFLPDQGKVDKDGGEAINFYFTDMTTLVNAYKKIYPKKLALPLLKDELIKDYNSTLENLPNISREMLRELTIPLEYEFFSTRKRYILSIIFIDIVGSTEALKNGKIRLNDVKNVLDSLCDCVSEDNGWVDKFMGDGALIVYGINRIVEPPKNNFFECHVKKDMEYIDYLIKKSLDMIKSFFCEIEKFGNDISLKVGIVIGNPLMGKFDAKTKFNYTVLGNSVNMASRLCDVARSQEILLTVNIETNRDGDNVENVQYTCANERFSKYGFNLIKQQNYIIDHWESRIVEVGLKGFSGLIDALSLYQKEFKTNKNNYESWF